MLRIALSSAISLAKKNAVTHFHIFHSMHYNTITTI